MKEYKLPVESFFGAWFIDTKICDDLVKFYKKIPKKFKSLGRVVRNNVPTIEPETKDSIELKISHTDIESPIKEYRNALQDCLNNYTKKYPEVNTYDKFNINEDFNLQYYKPKGGFKPWHFERSNSSSSKRVLVFSTYLNDVEEGGTEFKYQKLKLPAEKGLTLIFPPDWTHTHRGVISSTHEKYIITGWFSLNN